DASARGIVDGMLVRAENDRGSCFFKVSVATDIPPGVVRARSVRWNKRSVAGLGINQLTSERLTDIGGAPTFYSCLVEVSPVSQTAV
ncbi:MAG: molybdopterin oxidoreductase, partial [Acidobacteriaceae bacterium]|nr:molybdopterin oxidoreductase [Acidobacteriaceae bacterium]